MNVKSCILIDDDKDDQEIFAIALKEIDPAITFVTADGCEEGMTKLKVKDQFIPDYIFLDLNMPRSNGKNCLGQMKKLSHLQKVPIFIYTTSADPRDIQETRKLGASGFITKPYEVGVLVRTLTAVFSEGVSST